MTITNNGKKVAGAPIAMRIRGEATDAEAMAAIAGSPGITVYRLAKRLKWSVGRAGACIDRLRAQGKIRTRRVSRNGKLAKEAFPAGYAEKPYDIVEVPEGLVDAEEWKETAAVYALSRASIAIAPSPVKGWDRDALMSCNAPVTREGGLLRVRLPQELCRFYMLPNSETSLMASNGSVILTVEATVAEVDESN